MAVPTLSAVLPALGVPGGGNLVELQGTGFRPWSIPAPSNGPAGSFRETVAVTFGGAAATRVAVVSGTKLYCLAPRSPLPVVAPDYGEGAVDVVVQNLDDSGDPISGEAATLADGYTYQRVQLALESDLTRVVRILIREFRLQVHPNVSSSPHTDYDPNASDLANEVGLATLPGIALLGPELMEDRSRSFNARQIVSAPTPGQFLTRRAPYAVDLAFTLVGLSSRKIESINMMAAVQAFFEANKYLDFDRDPADPNKGTVRHPLHLLPGADMKADAGSNASNLRSFSGRFSLDGFQLEDLTGFDNQTVGRSAEVQETNAVVSQKADT